MGAPAITRVTAMRLVSRAYWVAVNRLSHRLMRNAAYAAVPIPLHRFSIPIAATIIG